MTSKAFLHKKTEIHAVIAEEETNLGGGEIAKPGMIIATYPDGNRYAFSVEEFADLYEEKKPHAWPGHINVANERGHFSGCQIEMFGPGDVDAVKKEIRDYFSNNTNLLVVDIKLTQTGSHVTATVFFTKVVTDEEISAFNRVQAKARELLDAEEAAHAEERATFMERAKKISVERRDAEIDQRNKERELIAKGEHCEKNHKKMGKK